MIAYDHQTILTNGVRLHVVLAGPADGKPVILLHGFPEFWYGWHNQINFLAEHGYRVIVPDQRGYNLSEKPTGIEAYDLSVLAKDVTGLMDALGYEQTYLVGHDWGAAVSWWTATLYPERIKKMAILNVPYPTLMGKAYQSGNLAQLFKSWYIFFFQIPKLPDAMLGAMNARGIEQVLVSSSKRNSFSEEDLVEYRRAWAQPGAITAMLNWYRAAGRSFMALRPPKDAAQQPAPRVLVPTLILWGERDVALDKSLAQPSLDICEDGRVVFFPKATHWVQHDEADAVNAHLIEHLRD